MTGLLSSCPPGHPLRLKTDQGALQTQGSVYNSSLGRHSARRSTKECVPAETACRRPSPLACPEMTTRPWRPASSSRPHGSPPEPPRRHGASRVYEVAFGAVANVYEVAFGAVAIRCNLKTIYIYIRICIHTHIYIIRNMWHAERAGVSGRNIRERGVLECE